MNRRQKKKKSLYFKNMLDIFTANIECVKLRFPHIIRLGCDKRSLREILHLKDWLMPYMSVLWVKTVMVATIREIFKGWKESIELSFQQHFGKYKIMHSGMKRPIMLTSDSHTDCLAHTFNITNISR